MAHRPPTTERAYVGIPDAAAYLDVDHKTIRRLITSGELPASRLGKRLIKIRLEDLDALLVPLRAHLGGGSVG